MPVTPSVVPAAMRACNCSCFASRARAATCAASGSCGRRSRSSEQQGARLAGRTLPDGDDIARCERFGVEGRVARAPGQRQVQLRGALAERGGQRQKAAMRIGAATAASGEVRTSSRIALEVAQRVIPAVPLVGDVALDQGQRHDPAVVPEVLERAQHRHAVRIVGDLGQEAPHLQFGIQSFAQAAVALEEQGLAERDDGVAAQRARPRHRQRRDVGRNIAELLSSA